MALVKFLYTDDFSCVEEMMKLKPVCASDPSTKDADSSGGSQGVHTQMSFLQSVLAVSHKYQIARLRLWCEQQLCEDLTVQEVCSVLCQAHLYEAKQLEEVCLMFVKQNLEDVVKTPTFGRLAKEWPEVMLKISLFMVGAAESQAAAVIAAQHQAPS